MLLNYTLTQRGRSHFKSKSLHDANLLQTTNYTEKHLVEVKLIIEVTSPEKDIS